MNFMCILTGSLVGGGVRTLENLNKAQSSVSTFTRIRAPVENLSPYALSLSLSLVLEEQSGGCEVIVRKRGWWRERERACVCERERLDIGQASNESSPADWSGSLRPLGPSDASG